MVHWVVWSGLAVVILAICFAFVREQRGGEAAVPSNPGLAKAGKPPVISQLTDFTLTNQLDQPVRLARFADKVWFADIVFTRCAGPCPTMTKRMAELQAHYADNPAVAFATLTTDPEFDTRVELGVCCQGGECHGWVICIVRLQLSHALGHSGAWPGAAGKHNVREPDLVRKSGQAHRLVELIRQGKVG